MALTFACFGVLNDRQIMLSAYLVRQVTELLIGTVFLRSPAVFVRLKSSAVPYIHIIENTMNVNMSLIGVNSKKILILIFQETLAHFSADFKSLFGCNFPRRKALNKMLREDGIQARSPHSYLVKIPARLIGISAAPRCNNEPAVVGLFGIGDVCQCFNLSSCDWKYLSGCQI